MRSWERQRQRRRGRETTTKEFPALSFQTLLSLSLSQLTKLFVGSCFSRFDALRASSARSGGGLALSTRREGEGTERSQKEGFFFSAASRLRRREKHWSRRRESVVDLSTSSPSRSSTNSPIHSLAAHQQLSSLSQSIINSSPRASPRSTVVPRPPSPPLGRRLPLRRRLRLKAPEAAASPTPTRLSTPNTTSTRSCSWARRGSRAPGRG